MSVVGKLSTNVTIKDTTKFQDLYVVRHLKFPLLGCPTLTQFDLVRRVEAVEDYPQLFTGLGELREPYHITLCPDAKPYAITVPRKIPVCYEQAAKKQIDHMEQQGVISRVEEPTEWCAGLVIVPKAALDNEEAGMPSQRSDSLRICVDLTQLNKCHAQQASNARREQYSRKVAFV